MPLHSHFVSSFCAAASAVLCCLPITSFAQSSTSNLPAASDHSDRLYASPDLGRGKPSLNSDRNRLELPVSIAGFSTVALRDSQEWHHGSQQYQLVFDGQIYWFRGDRERDIFAAAPQQYAPVLGGDCVVTYVHTGERRLGRLEYGLIHSRRIYFFADSNQRELFRADPEQFSSSDLANRGKCLVSQLTQKRYVTGLPETAAVVNGLRYHFAGTHERNQFAANMSRFGVKRELAQARGDRTQQTLVPRPLNTSIDGQASEGSRSKLAIPLPKKDTEGSEDHHYVMEGYCPVSILDQGIWVRGNYRNLVKHEGRKYLLAGEKEKGLFLEAPERYTPALGGDCIVSQTDDRRVAPGGVYNSLVVEGRLYLFAGAEQKQTFLADPSRYIEQVDTTKKEIAENEAPSRDQPSEDPDSEK